MRLSPILILLAGCATETTGAASEMGTTTFGSDQCALHKATILAPAPDAVVSGTSADVRVSWNPEPHSEAVQVDDATGKTYLPTASTVDTDGVHVYHFVLPASTQFDVRVDDICVFAINSNNDMRALALALGSETFATGPSTDP